MLTIERDRIRKQFAALLTAALEGPGKPVQKVFDYQIADWGARSPVLVVTEAGSEWRRFVHGAGTPNGHVLNLHTFVLYANADGSMTEQASEDMLSPIVEGVAAVVYANQHWEGLWGAIDWQGASTIDAIKIRGNEYRHEATVLMFR